MGARYEDEQNYVALIRVQEFGVWNLVEVADGIERRIDTVQDIPIADVGVALETGNDIVVGAVGLNRVTVVASPRLASHRPAGLEVGLIASGDQAATCTWDDIVVRRAR